MFMLDMEVSDVSKYRPGNDKSSAIKLMILFQEIIFNAVKYASFVARKDRFIEIRLIDHEQNLSLTVSNSYRPEVQAKTTGVGKLVIENFAKVLDCQPEITTTDQVYTIRMEFNNIWRNHAQDPLH
jgi:two-component sensor histidine kinase